MTLLVLATRADRYAELLHGQELPDLEVMIEFLKRAIRFGFHLPMDATGKENTIPWTILSSCHQLIFALYAICPS
jgi:hypothetical protein